MNTKQYTIDENNEHEGETFGYIMNLTEAEYLLINTYILTEEQQTKRYEEDEEYTDNGFTIYRTNYTDEEVKLVNKHNRNGYKSRLAFYTFKNDLFEEFERCKLDIVADEDEDELWRIDWIIPNDIFYKGIGLTKIK